MRPLETLLDSIKEGNVDMALVDRMIASAEARRSVGGRLHGCFFRMSSASLDDFEGRVSDLQHHVTGEFRQHYEHHMRAMSAVALSAKVYLVKNWEQVKDWSGLHVVIEDGTGYATEYYNNGPRQERRQKKMPDRDGQNERESSIMDKALASLDRHMAARHNPVVSVTDVVLDTSDEDFSLTINGTSHWWINDESVVIIAGYAEEQIKKQNEATDRITEA